MYIGKKIREIRKSQGMTLNYLAEKSGIQIATLSRIENLKMTGTLDSHVCIAKVLDVAVPQLYTELISDKDSVELQKPGTPTDVFVGSSKSSYKILTQNVAAKKMLPQLVKIEHQGQVNKEKYDFGSEKFIFVLHGKIEIEIIIDTPPTHRTDSYILRKENTLYFDASLEHTIINIGKTDAEILSILTPTAL